jgi:hypothetical protein
LVRSGGSLHKGQGSDGSNRRPAKQRARADAAGASSAAEAKQLRVLAGREPLKQIAKALGRTAMATRRKATAKRISLRMKG